MLFLDSPTAHAAMRRHQLVPYVDAGDVHARDGDRLAFIDAAIVEVTRAMSPPCRASAIRSCRRRAPPSNRACAPPDRAVDPGRAREPAARRSREGGAGAAPAAPRPSPERNGAMDIRAISLDLDDTLWPIAPVIQRVEQHARCPAARTLPRTSPQPGRSRHATCADEVARDHPEHAHDFRAQRRLTLRRGWRRSTSATTGPSASTRSTCRRATRSNAMPTRYRADRVVGTPAAGQHQQRHRRTCPHRPRRAFPLQRGCLRCRRAKPAPEIFHHACTRPASPRTGAACRRRPACDVAALARAAGMRTV